MGGCVACYKAPGSNPALNEPAIASREPIVRTVKKPSGSEDFWSTSTFDMDNSTFPSQGSISSIGTSNHNFADSQAGSRNSNAPTEFVNHGLRLWNQTREHWVGKKRPDNPLNHNQEPKLKHFTGIRMIIS
ncbi:PREDICTED: uncharacterized protein LOC104808233 isoform X2 [Tarenaya hassleriana]|uniref:uncharacterized protein LOC104808233 isoform X2 n=1 Tax=Tarenaya hassleriana TaxID=28532 RepID=UPI0008FCED83|nr:PREDICTED: uncharacterized protein LOC104808233 isoform X2 [Tarenaya hassleriana]